MSTTIQQFTVIMLPAMGSGYYIISPSARQFGTQATVKMLVDIARQQHWNLPDLPIGIGDLSFKDGANMFPPHHAHRHGRNVDLRPFRKDRRKLATNIHDPSYDHEMTKLLVKNLLAHRNVHRILFNDIKIHGVHFFPHHDNHLHVETKA
jgi:penicillin-insensitive murein endopeptidase